MEEKKQKLTHSQKLIETIENEVKKHEFLQVEATKTFLALLKKHAKEIDTRTSEAFKEMVEKRKASKYVGMSKADFKAMLQKQIDEAQAIFDKAQKLTKEDLADVERMKEKTKTTRAKKLLVEDLLNDK